MLKNQQIIQSVFDILKAKNNESSTHYVVNVNTNINLNSGVTTFDALSNENKIVLKSKLSDVDDKIAIQLLKIVLDNDYTIIGDINKLQALLDETFSSELLISLTNGDACAWYNVFLKLAKYTTIVNTPNIPSEVNINRNPAIRYKKQINDNFKQTIIHVDNLTVYLYFGRNKIHINH